MATKGYNMPTRLKGQPGIKTWFQIKQNNTIKFNKKTTWKTWIIYEPTKKTSTKKTCKDLQKMIKFCIQWMLKKFKTDTTITTKILSTYNNNKWTWRHNNIQQIQQYSIMTFWTMTPFSWFRLQLYTMTTTDNEGQTDGWMDGQT